MQVCPTLPHVLLSPLVIRPPVIQSTQLCVLFQNSRKQPKRLGRISPMAEATFDSQGGSLSTLDFPSTWNSPRFAYQNLTLDGSMLTPSLDLVGFHAMSASGLLMIRISCLQTGRAKVTSVSECACGSSGLERRSESTLLVLTLLLTPKSEFRNYSLCFPCGFLVPKTKSHTAAALG